MCEKCRSGRFQSGDGGGVGVGSKKFENWGRLKNFRTAGLTDLGGLLLLGEGSSTQLHAM